MIIYSYMEPKKSTHAKEGTQVFDILQAIIVNGVTGESFTDISDTLYRWYNIEVNRRRISEVITKYNNGGYFFMEESVSDTGRIYPITITKEDTDNHTHTPTPENDPDQTLMTFHDHCRAEGIEPSNTTGGWIKTKNLSVRIKEEEVDASKELTDLLLVAKERLVDAFWETTPSKPQPTDGERVGVVHLADLHIGAYVTNLVKTPDYNLDILKEKLLRAATAVNGMRFDDVHVKLYGDLIESFSGVNHKNTWKELEQGIYGVEAVKIVVDVIDNFFLKHINNVVRITMIGGNHDRVTQNNVEDSKGGVSDLVAFCLRLIGYDVEFNPLVISEEIDGIQYIMLHGDKGISKRPTKEIIWDYGKQGIFNYVLEGHLHSRIQRLTTKAADSFRVITDDSIDCRRQVLPSIFTGNSYSDDNNWFSTSGIVITQNNGYGVPTVVDVPV